MIRFIVIKTGQELDRHLNSAFARLSKILQDTDVAPDMQKCVQTHFQRKYPGSKHWDPDKVTVTGKSKIHVAVPGVMRAYRDVTIRPIKAKHLTIPLHAEAYGKSAPEVKGLFRFRNMLAVHEGPYNAIIPWFLLVDEVHQKQDTTLMPTDQELAGVVITKLLKSIKGAARRPWL